MNRPRRVGAVSLIYKTNIIRYAHDKKHSMKRNSNHVRFVHRYSYIVYMYAVHEIRRTNGS